MADRAQLKAEKREVLGKKVKRLRRAGILPATVYGHRMSPQSIQVDARTMRDVMREAGTTQLIDLEIDDQLPRPVLIRQTTVDPKRNSIIHVEFFQANLQERMTTHLRLHFVGESPAAKQGGILLHLLDHIDVECLPEEVPAGGVEVDVSRITELNGVIHAGELELASGLTLLTPPDEVVAKVNPPIAAEVVEEAVAEVAPLPEEPAVEEASPDSGPGS